jgi:Holliday junction resolvase RusA-like endonuclease
VTTLVFVVPGHAQGKQRPRLGKGGRVYTPPATRRYEQHVALAFLAASKGRKRSTYTGPVELHIACTFSDHRRRDLDNVIKAILDGLNGIAYADDCQVCTITAERRHGAAESAEVCVVWHEEREL